MLELSCFFTFLFAAEPSVSFTIPGRDTAADDVDEDGLDDDDDEAAAGLAEESDEAEPEVGRDAPPGLETVLGFVLLPP